MTTMTTTERISAVIAESTVCGASRLRNGFGGFDIPVGNDGEMIRLYADDNVIVMVAFAFGPSEWEASFTEGTPRSVIVAALNVAVAS